jgi:NNP family nitrate/nitrite transporter-like MFS transporter
MKLLLLVLFWALWYLNFSSRTILAPLLPLIEDALSINHAMAGGFFFAFSVGYTIALLGSGLTALRIGYKKSILLSFIILVLCYSALGLATSYRLFMTIMFFMGISSGFYLPCAIPLITAAFPRAHWGKAISVHETAAGFSILSLPFLTVLALRFIQWRTIFWVLAAACLAIIFFLMAFLPDPRPLREQKDRLSVVLRRKEFWIIGALWVSCAMASIGIFNIVPLFLVKERGIAMDLANTIFGFSRAGGFVGQIAIGFILDRFAIKKLLYFLTLASGLTTIGLALSQAYWLLVGMLFLQATFSVVFFPVGLMAIARVTRQSERSLFTGALMSFSSIIGLGLSSVMLGAVADVWSFQIGILALGILITLSCLTYKSFKNI